MAATDQPRDPREEVRAEIREFLSTRRARITPEQAGLPTYGDERRRVPGLRREEVALLAGVSPQYYVRLERGDATGISESVIDGIAHALQLDDAERAHLVDLLRTAGTPTRPRRRTPAAPQRVRPTIQRLVDSMHAHARGGPQRPPRRSLAANALGTRTVLTRCTPTPTAPPATPGSSSSTREATTFFRDWDTVANDTVAILRAEAGRDPYDRDLSDLVGQLSTRSDDFRRPLGRPRRPHPLHRRQALPPPRRRRPRPALRVPPPGTRIEHQPGRLHPRAGLTRPRRPRPARQLGRQRSRRGSADRAPSERLTPGIGAQ